MIWVKQVPAWTCSLGNPGDNSNEKVKIEVKKKKEKGKLDLFHESFLGLTEVYCIGSLQ